MTIPIPAPQGRRKTPEQYLEQFSAARLQALTDDELDAVTAGAVAATARSDKAREGAYQAVDGERHQLRSADSQYDRAVDQVAALRGEIDVAETDHHAIRESAWRANHARVRWWQLWSLFSRRRARRALEAHVALMAQLQALFDKTDAWLRRRHAELPGPGNVAQAERRHAAACEAVRRLGRERERREVQALLGELERLQELPAERLKLLRREARDLRDRVRSSLGGEPDVVARKALWEALTEAVARIEAEIAARGTDGGASGDSPPDHGGNDDDDTMAEVVERPRPKA